MKRTTYTKQEDALILNYIAKYPNNIKHAMKLASEQIGRTADAVAFRYYKRLKYTNTVIAVASKTGISTMNNQKNSPIMQGIKEEDILSIILASLRKLSKKSKLQVVSAILNY